MTVVLYQNVCANDAILAIAQTFCQYYCLSFLIVSPYNVCNHWGGFTRHGKNQAKSKVQPQANPCNLTNFTSFDKKKYEEDNAYCKKEYFIKSVMVKNCY